MQSKLWTDPRLPRQLIYFHGPVLGLMAANLALFLLTIYYLAR